ncbi:MAG: DUF4124 domain-containing protein [Betaproteobacteria bacterium]|nr:DUF4124 domain-containing protein [Betaproteobacteria bacterium]
MRTVLALVLLSLIGPAWAGATCKYVDGEGRITFANVPVKNARKVACFDPVPPPAPKRVTQATPKPSTPSQPQPSAKVEPDVQQRRDLDRQRILQQELAEEIRLLEEAKRLFLQGDQTRSQSSSAAAQVLERLGPVSDAVQRHERNIDALRRELAAAR